MNRRGFEHVIRAAAAVVDDELVVVGSQAVLAHDPDPPPTIVTSMELDLYPRRHPERSIEIDGSLGDGSRFHEMYGYYAHGVGPETVIAPAVSRDPSKRRQRRRLVSFDGRPGSRQARCRTDA
jgi:hypothetical protein